MLKLVKARPAAGAFFLLGVLLILTALVYAPGLSGPFLLDDRANIPQARIHSPTPAAIAEVAFADQHFFGLSRAIPRLSFAATFAISGDGSRGFKIGNLLLHLANGLLIYWLVLLLARHASAPTDAPQTASNLSQAPAFALGVAAIWLLHPLQVSTVLYAVQRIAQWSALFTLAALIAYVQGRRLARSRSDKGAAVMLLGVVGFGVGGLMSKETAVLLPLFILLIELFFFRLQTGSQRERGWLIVVLTLLVGLPIAAGLAVGTAKLDALLGWNAVRGFSGTERLLTEVRVIGLYLKQIWFPTPSSMSLFHDDFPLTRALDPGTLGLALAYTVAIATAVLLRRRAPWIGFGILWFFCCHLLESTVIPLELVFEHRNYLAIVGPAVILVASLELFGRQAVTRRASLVAMVAISALLAANTAVRAHTWGDMGRLLYAEVQQHPNSSRLLAALISYHSRRGDQQQAIAWLNRLLALDLRDAGPEVTALLVYCPRGPVPKRLWQRTRAKLAEGSINPFEINGLASLMQHAEAGQCPAIETKGLEELLSAALANPRDRGPDQRCHKHALYTRVLLQRADDTALRKAFSRELSVCVHARRPTLRFVIDDLVERARKTEQLDRIRPLLEQAAAGPAGEQLDHAYAGSGGFDPRNVIVSGSGVD